MLNLFKAKEGMTGDLSESSGALKEEILRLLKEKERTLLKQVFSTRIFFCWLLIPPPDVHVEWVDDSVGW